ncbi:pirin family protein [Aeromicrobium duanguangcaii]|uniref:Pirin family protein n=1 Tax=Aeromicrobium duanguangcaii TaxID=2968086 RepID=A0ABY5KIE3_9ACTN|nr:pirin family protein [Aeromicrobium duanguangcaii]MCD9154101.1 pirin family protein [Aeromicrobium duanguangcaii]MCL3837837.1 pirin family protein [Aeromicrobium duanguangcaii]UUI68826.1 pirin family protein [Aeromicrobium duanguangcaii]
MPESRVLRRAADRFHTVASGTETFHSFSYGRHYDPDNVGFGPVIAINEERIAPGAGYDEHHHADAEIVTWVLDGVLGHEDSTGHCGEVRPGVAQRLSAGAGVTHAERNGSDVEPLRFVQMMLRSTNWDEPEYAQAAVPDGPGLHETVPVHADARLLVARPGPDASVELEVEHGALLHVTRGPVSIDDTTLGAGDEMHVTGPDRLRLTGRDGEVFVWLFR